MVEIIKNYLESDTSSYDEGVLLLSKQTKNRNLLSFLSRKENKPKLIYELRKVLKRYDKSNVLDTSQKEAETRKQKLVPLIAPIGRTRITRDNNEMKFEDCSPEKQALWTENTEAYQESRSIHEKLKLLSLGSDKDRSILIDRLISLSILIRKNFDAIDLVTVIEADTKVNPITTKPVIVDTKRITANRKYISVNLPKFIKNENSELADKIQERVTEITSANQTFSDKLYLKMENLGFLMGTKS